MQKRFETLALAVFLAIALVAVGWCAGGGADYGRGPETDPVAVAVLLTATNDIAAIKASTNSWTTGASNASTATNDIATIKASTNSWTVGASNASSATGTVAAINAKLNAGVNATATGAVLTNVNYTITNGIFTVFTVN